MSAVIPLVAAMCGPKTDVSNARSSFKSSLNTFMFAICAPSGGKSMTRDKVMKPVLENWQHVTGKRIEMESYTIAGLQSHQKKIRWIRLYILR